MFHKFIHDEDQIRKFVSLLSPLKGDEAYFLSLSARNKYLTEEERRVYDLGRTEMFARKLVKRDKKKIVPMEDNYLRVLKSMQVSHGGYTSRSGVTLPDKCLVVYANINPVSGLKALKEFQTKIMDSLFDMRTNSEAPDNFSNLDTQLMNCYQRSRGTRTLIDIDFDIPEDGIDILKTFTSIMRENEVKYHVIKTKSGFHVLLEKANIKFNYVDIVKNCHIEAVKRFGLDHVEVMQNNNSMVPVPGCRQADFPVHFLDM
jgi:hypothetical protein